MLPVGPDCPATPEAEAFVRFCYQRRRVGWPELYDEMCAVATRGLFHGMGPADLADVGIGFSLYETPRLAQLVVRIAREEQEARRAARRAIVDGMTAGQAAAGEAPAEAPVAQAPVAEPPVVVTATNPAPPNAVTEAAATPVPPKPLHEPARRDGQGQQADQRLRIAYVAGAA